MTEINVFYKVDFWIEIANFFTKIVHDFRLFERRLKHRSKKTRSNELR